MTTNNNKCASMPCNVGKPLSATEQVAITQAVGQYGTFQVSTAYLGEVPLQCADIGRGYVALIAPVKAMDNRTNIIVKEIDASMYNLSADANYPLSFLQNLAPTVVNINECKRHGEIIKALRAKKDTLTPQEQQTLQRSLLHNNVVDIHFLTCLYVEFLHEKINVNNILKNNFLISLHNCKRLDNAYFTGSYMVYGNGDQYFYPMGSLDIGGHELGHGIVQLLAGLIYQGHAGGLNESFADVFGCAFEFYAYEKFPQLFGVSDWTMGEDVGKRIKILRNMENPFLSDPPQPKQYRGQYWADPNSTADYGGVHTNSSVGNFCFYNFCKSTDVKTGLNVFTNALKLLKPNASYLDYRDALKKAGINYAQQMQDALNLSGLTDNIVNDWKQTTRTIAHEEQKHEEQKHEKSQKKTRKHRQKHRHHKHKH